jgi:hypothetical protein
VLHCAWARLGCTAGGPAVPHLQGVSRGEATEVQLAVRNVSQPNQGLVCRPGAVLHWLVRGIVHY